MTQNSKNDNTNDLWKALDRLAAIASVILVLALTYLYFQLPSWSFLPQHVREFLMAILTNIIPVYILFAVSYFLLRQIQKIRDRQKNEDVAKQIAQEVMDVLQQGSSKTDQSNATKFAQARTIKTREGITAANQQLIADAKLDIISFSGDLSWTKQCHSDLLNAVDHGVSVRILCKDPLTDEAKKHVERYMRQPGVEVKYYPSGFDPDIRGLMIDTSTSKRAIFVEKKHKTLGDTYERTGVPGDTTTYEYWGQHFDAKNDLAIISPLVKLFDVLWTHANDSTVLYTGEWNQVKRELKRLPQYQQAEVSLRSAKIANLKPLHRFIDAQELRNIENLAVKLQAHNIPLWSLVSIHSGISQKSICPPIVEIHNGEWILLDGLARTYYAKQCGLADIVACVVENVSESVSGDPWDWDSVQIVENSNYSKSENFRDFNSAHWRSFDSIHAALEQIKLT